MNFEIIVKERASNLRAFARMMIKGQWKLAVLATLLYFVALYLPTYIIDLILEPESTSGALLTFLYYLLVGGPLMIGYFTIMLSIQRKKGAIILDVFSGFEQFGRAVCINLAVCFFVVLWMIPSIILFCVASTLLISNGMAEGSIIGGILLMILAIVALALPIRAEIAYSQCYFLAIDNPNLGALESIRQSKMMMKGNKWKLVCVNLSFIGWYLLCSLPMLPLTIMEFMKDGMANDSIFSSSLTSTLGMEALVSILSIGYLWLLPYISVTMTAFYEILMGRLTITYNTQEIHVEKAIAEEHISINEINDDIK